MDFRTMGMIVGIGCGLIIAAIILKVTKNDGSSRCKYDERQIAARGKAYKMGFFTLLIYNFLYGAFGMAITKTIVDPFTAMMVGIILAVTVQVSYCIWHDAYVSLNEDKKKVMWASCIIALANLIPGILSVVRQGLVIQGSLNMRCMNILCGGLMIYIFVLYRMKLAHDQKEEEI